MTDTLMGGLMSERAVVARMERKRNPGRRGRQDALAPDCASLHPDYEGTG